MKKSFSIIIIISLIFSAGSSLAYIMSSPNYRIQSDSINVGGVRQTSSNYQMEDTIGEIATGESTSASYKLKAGYQQMQEVYISISAPADLTMTPTILGITGGISNGSTSWNVVTDNPAGYTLKIKATTSPALIFSNYSFADYTPVNSTIPDFNWSVPATTSEFGFTPEGNHIVQKYRDDISSCNIGTNDTSDRCWYNFSTSNENIAYSSASNHPSGTPTVVKFRAESGSSHLQVGGTYQAIIIVTAITN